MRCTGRRAAGGCGTLATAVAAVALIGGPVRADLPVEAIGNVTQIALPYSPHWVVIGDAIGRRAALLDVDDGNLLGLLDSGWGVPQTLHPASRPEIYVAETHYSRGSRGVRSDVLTIYAAGSLAPVSEIELPPKRAFSSTPQAHSALSDDDRFAAIFNLTPATSMSIVDLERRRFVEEIATPGCGLVYPVGPRRFAALCMNGSLLLVALDDEGHEIGKERSPPFFDPESDPVTEKAARWRDRWLFVSFEGWVHPVRFAAGAPEFEERWSLLSDDDRAQDWKIGGAQHFAVHEATGHAYALMHQGGPDSHKQGGTEVWVYDLATRARILRIELQSPGFTYLGVPIDGGPRWSWLVDWISNLAMKSTPELGIDCIAVTQDDDPRLVTTGLFSGGVATYDALSGDFLGRVYTGNMTNVVVQAPFRQTGAAP
ncbi:MAG: amine dehydrogenase large subunit [Myxococcota bacterium]